MRQAIFFLSLSLAAGFPQAGGMAEDMPKDDRIHTFYSNIKTQGENRWYSSEANAEADPALFNKRVREKVEDLQKKIRALKEKAAARQNPAERAKNEKELREMEKNLERADRNFKIYKTGGALSAGARKSFEEAMAGADENFRSAVSAALPENEAFQWQAESGLDDRKYQIEQLKAAAAQSDRGERDKVERKIKKLEEKNKAVREKLDKLKKGEAPDAKSVQDEIRRTNEEFDKSYLWTADHLKEHSKSDA